MKNSLLAGLTTASLVSVGAMFSAAPAEAFTISNGNVLDITSASVGKSFDVIFDQGGGNFADDLKATGTFKLTSFADNVAEFSIDLKNTSTVASTWLTDKT